MKIKKLRLLYAGAKTDADKKVIAEKMFRTSPFAPLVLE